jgi:hypothetical protein
MLPFHALSTGEDLDHFGGVRLVSGKAMGKVVKFRGLL